MTKLTELAYNFNMKEWTPEEIKDLRQRLNLSQIAFGDRLGVTRNYIYYLEKGVKIPSKTLRLLLDCLDKEAEGKRKRKGE